MLYEVITGIDDCIGCFQCIIKGEESCPHYDQVSAVMKALEAADVIIIDSPTYVMNVTGQLKTFFDHMAYRWISHRPHPS